MVAIRKIPPHFLLFEFSKGKTSRKIKSRKTVAPVSLLKAENRVKMQSAGQMDGPKKFQDAGIEMYVVENNDGNDDFETTKTKLAGRLTEIIQKERKKIPVLLNLPKYVMTVGIVVAVIRFCFG